jgi:hypothetical protein
MMSSIQCAIPVPTDGKVLLWLVRRSHLDVGKLCKMSKGFEMLVKNSGQEKCVAVRWSVSS